MRVRITRKELEKLNRRGKIIGATSIRKIDNRTHEVAVHDTKKTVVVGV